MAVGEDKDTIIQEYATKDGDDLWTVGRDGTTLRREGDAWTLQPTGH